MNKPIRALVILATNAGLGFAILHYHQVMKLWLVFAATAIGLLLLAFPLFRKKNQWMLAILISFVLSALVPTIALAFLASGKVTLESMSVVGLVAIGLSWKECLMMWALNSVLLSWYSRA